MKRKQVRALVVAGSFVTLCVGALLIAQSYRHPNGVFGGHIRNSYYESDNDKKVRGYMNNFNARSEAGETVQWRLLVASISQVNSDGHGVYVYEGYDDASHQRVLVLWPADGNYQWSKEPNIATYAARVRNRCPQYCDFNGIKAPGTIGNTIPTESVEPTDRLPDLRAARQLINAFQPAGHYGVWGIFLSDWLIKKLPQNGRICISMAAKSDNEKKPKLRSVVSLTNEQGRIQYNQPLYVSDWDQIMATIIVASIDRPH